jgi:lipopolysaccharide transport system ATP-binding protein
VKSISIQHLGKDFLRPGRSGKSVEDRFVALDDVSFDAEPGDIVGILGRNGAGKSTLLKILARILRPTRGRVELTGRLGSLLELGAAFHPDLSGRENIFLNAAVLGMGRSEIMGKFDTIAEFAGFPDRLDEPVKHYSSGMYMRLAFAVAAHVDPEILLMDEVLAVGDVDFQRKSMDRLAQVGRNGQTVVFVSHNVHAVLRLCNRAVLLDQGRVLAKGDTRDVVSTYLSLFGTSEGERYFGDPQGRPGDGVVRLSRIRVVSRNGDVLSTLELKEAFGIEMEFDVLAPGMTLFPSLTVNNEWGPLCWTTDTAAEGHGAVRECGSYRTTAWFPENFLSNGRMTITAAMLSFAPYTVHFDERDIVSFQAIESHGGSRGLYPGHVDGGIRPLLRWVVERQP